MNERNIPDPVPESTLAHWASEGSRFEAAGRNLISFASPEEVFTIEIAIDNPLSGYLVRLYQATEVLTAEDRIACMVVEDPYRALEVAETMATRVDELAGLDG